MYTWKLYFEGSCHTEGSGIGLMVVSLDSCPTKLLNKLTTKCSNNEAEYEATIAGLELLLEFNARKVLIRGDSLLVINQLKVEYKCDSQSLLKYFNLAKVLIKKFEEVVLDCFWVQGDRKVVPKLGRTICCFFDKQDHLLLKIII